MRVVGRPIRRAATITEFALTASVALFLILSLIVGGMGIFRYQEVAHLAREGARYASTHGGTYVQEGRPQQTGVSAISSSSDLSSYLTDKTVSLDAGQLQVSVSWTAPNTVSPSNTPTYVDTSATSGAPGQSVIQNYVIVTVSYQWMPELYLAGPITLTSTAEMPMSY